MHNDIACSCLENSCQEHAKTEAGVATPVYTNNRDHPTSSTTSVDVLHVRGVSREAASWTEKVDHDSLIKNFEVRPRTPFTSVSVIGNTI